MYACLSIVGATDPDDHVAHALMAVTYPLCKIAEKLGVSKVEADLKLPPGIWIYDGTGDGAAYNYIELIDKMTERLADVRQPVNT